MIGLHLYIVTWPQQITRGMTQVVQTITQMSHLQTLFRLKKFRERYELA